MKFIQPKLVLTPFMALLLSNFALGHSAQAQTTSLVSVGANGQGDGSSSATRLSISANGRYIAFSSQATNLATGDANGANDVFVRDLVAGTTRLVSVSTGGGVGNGASNVPSISSDGRYVAFLSSATDLVAGDTNGVADAFLRDLQAGTTTRVSVATNGAQGDLAAGAPAINADGTKVAFSSDATNIVAGDTNTQVDVFVRDLAAGTTKRVSVATDGTQANNDVNQASLSGDGRYVVFWSYATNLVPGDTNNGGDVFLHDLNTNITTRISVASNGSQATGAAGSFSGIISQDGTKVAFYSDASDLVANDTFLGNDVFVRDLSTNTTRLVSVSSSGAQGNNSSTGSAISADGNKIVFASGASNLASGDTNAVFDVFVRDLNAGTTTPISVNTSGTPGNGLSSTPSISGDGSKIAFHSDATDLVANDTNSRRDVFVRGAAAPVNNAPTLDAISNANYKLNGGTQTVPLTGISDGDSASQVLAVSAVSSDPSKATVSVNYTPSGTTGSLTITPVAVGTTTITVTVRDNGTPNQSTQRQFTVSVANAAPVANPQSVSANENTARAITLTGSDSDGDRLTYTVVASPAHGTLGGTAPNLTYVPSTGYSGPDSFSFRVNDGSVDSSASTVSITVVAANRAPVLSGIEGTALAYNKGDGLRQLTSTLTVADVDSTTLTGATVNITSGFSSTEDSLAFTPGNGISGVYSGAAGTLTLSGTASVAAYQAALRSVTYRNGNTVNPSTSDRVFTFQVNDGGAAGTNLSNAVTRTATITSQNAAPVNSVPGPQTVNEDSQLAFSAANNNRITISDTDAGNGTLTVTLSVTNGTLTKNGAQLTSTVTITGTVTSINSYLDGLTYVPSANFFGASTLTITTNDSGNSGSGGPQTDTDTVSITVQPINDAPSFTPGGAVTVNEDAGAYSQPWASAISAGPANESGQALSFAATNTNNALFAVQPAIAPNGTLSFTPAANASGSATVRVVLSDNGGTANGGVDTAAAVTFSITVQAINDAPTLNDPADLNLSEGAATQVVNLSGITAGGGESQTLTVTATSDNTALVPNPSVTYTSPNTTGSLSLTPAPNRSGVATITVTVTDNGGTASGGVNTFSQQFTVTVAEVNDPPSFTLTANPPAVDEDAGAQVLAGFATNISAGPNESGQTLTFLVTSNTNPALFAVAPSIASNGTLSYTPAANANGTATFILQLQDSGSNVAPNQNTSAAQTFTITVNAVNDAPTISAVADQSTSEDTPTGAIAFTVGDQETAPASLTVSATSSNAALVPAAGIVLGGSGANRTVALTPAPNQSGTATITLTVSDGTTTSRTSFDLQVLAVNDAPSFALASNPPAVDEDGGAQTVAGFATAISPGPNESAQSVAFAVTGNSNAALFSVAPAISPDGTLTYTPAPDQNGTATISVVLRDNGGTDRGGVDTSAAQTFTITVDAVNDAPVNSVPGPQSTPEDTALVIDDRTRWSPSGISVDDADSQTLTLTLSVARGTLTLSQTTGLTFTAGDGTADATMTFRGDKSDLNAALSGLVYAPAANFNGSDVLTVSSDDGQAPAVTSTVAITVSPVNDAPVASDGSATTDEDTAVTINAKPLARDIETASADLAYAVVDQPDAAEGSVAVGTAPGTFVFTPAPNFNGTSTFTYKVTDTGDPAGTPGNALGSNTATITVTVDAVNDAPTISAIADQSTNEDTPTSPIAFTIGDLDNAPASLTVSATSSNAALVPAAGIVLGGSGANRTVALTPAPNQSGTATITLTVSDGTTTSRTSFDLQVLAVNDAPVAAAQSLSTNEDTPLALTLAASDIDSAALTYRVVTPPAHGTLSGTGANLRYTPAANFNGDDFFTFRANDGALDSNVARVSLTVRPVNDAPTATPQSAQTPEDQALKLTLVGRDIDGDALTYSLSGTPLYISRAAEKNPDYDPSQLRFDGPNVTFTPPRDFFGTFTFAFTASDGRATSAPTFVTIEVTSVNDAPIARADSATTPARVPVTVPVLANDSDVDGNALTVTAVDAAGTRGTLAISADKKSVLFTPDASFSGATSFGYTISDGALTASARVTVQVTPVNRAPVGVADSYSGQGTLQVLAAQGVLQNDTDADGDALTATLKSTPAHGTLDLGADGSFVYTPAVGYSGPDSFTYAASDGQAESAPVTVSLTVAAQRDVTPPALALAGGKLRVSQRLIPLRGSAADVYVLRSGPVVSSGLKSVAVRLQRFGGDYWNGRSYQKAPFDLPTQKLERSFFTVPASAMPPLSQAPGGRYLWTATATDNVGNTTRDTQSMLVDATAPRVTIATPAAGSDGVARLSSLDGVSGRVSEAARVVVALRNSSGAYFNGRAFVAAPTFLAATSGASIWSLQLPGLALAPGRYTLVVRAADAAGNLGQAARVVLVASAPNG